jgi:hypothetical protein
MNKKVNFYIIIKIKKKNRYIFNNPNKFRINILTFELYDQKQNLVAVELGYLVGSIYTRYNNNNNY